MLNVISNPQDAIMWMEAINAVYYGKGKPFERADSDRLLGRVSGECAAKHRARIVADGGEYGLFAMRHVCFAEELIAAYPEAKVILSLRDVDSWYNSMLATVVKVSKSRVLNIWGSFGPVFLRHWNPMRKKLGTAFWGGDFESHGKGKFEEHYAMVKETAPKESLLEYRVGEWWERLCGFLEIPVPEEEFLVTNEQSTLVRIFEFFSTCLALQ